MCQEEFVEGEKKLHLCLEWAMEKKIRIREKKIHINVCEYNMHRNFK